MNKQEKKWKVYKHTGPTGKVYIGITMQSLSRRWRDGKAYWGSIKFYNAIKKYGWESFKHEQLADQLTFEEASAIEISLIQYYKDLGISYNISVGGECGIQDEVTRIKLSQSKKGKSMHPNTREALLKANLGKHRSQETREKISRANLGKKKSAEACQHMSESKNKPVLQLDITTEEVLNEFISASVAAEAVGTYQANISRCCKLKHKTCKGYKWRYKNEN